MTVMPFPTAVPDADTYTDPPVVKFRRARFIRLPRIDKSNDAESAKTITPFQRTFVQASTANRIIVQVFGAKLLIPKATH